MTGKPDSSANSSKSGSSNENSVTGIAQRLSQSRPASVPSSGAPVPKKKKPTPKQATKKKASLGNKKNTKKMKKDQSEEKSEQPPTPKQANKKKNTSANKKKNTSANKKKNTSANMNQSDENLVTKKPAKSRPAPDQSSEAPVLKKKKDQSEEETSEPPKPKQATNHKTPAEKTSDGDASWIQTSDENDWMVEEACKNLFDALHF